jgi:2,3-dihydroxybiphenyl 1,2-dioxygenase
MRIARLGYVGIATQQLDEWRSIGEDILAGEVREAGEASARTLKLRIDAHPFRCLFVEAEKDDVLFAGWEAADEPAFAALLQQIEAAGAKVEAADEALLSDREVHGLARFRDPDGYLNELYWGPLTAPFAALNGHGGYLTGDLGLGHVMRHCARYPEMVEFYTRALGFRLSDKIVWDGADASFLRCNARHHSLALINESLGMKSGDTNHIMFEVNSFDDVTRAYETVLERGYPIIMTLGRHSNCKTVSFYFVGPSGFGIEIGHGGRLVDEENWEVAQYDSTKIWGHLLPHERVKELI